MEGRGQIAPVAETRKCDGSTVVLIQGLGFVLEIFGRSFHFKVEDCGFIAPYAEETPAGGNDLGDKAGFEVILRLEVVAVLVMDFLQLSGIVGLEEDSFGGEAVFDGVPGGAGASGGGSRTAGSGAAGGFI